MCNGYAKTASPPRLHCLVAWDLCSFASVLAWSSLGDSDTMPSLFFSFADLLDCDFYLHFNLMSCLSLDYMSSVLVALFQ